MSKGFPKIAMPPNNLVMTIMGAKSIEQARENLELLGQGPITGKEFDRVRFTGTHI